MGTKGKWGTTMLAAAIALALASPALADRPAGKRAPGYVAMVPLPAPTVAPAEVVESSTVTEDAAWSDASLADDVFGDAAWSDAAWSDVSSVE